MMKRKILSSLVGLSMLGVAASAHAYIFDLANGDLNGAFMTVAGLPVGGAPDRSFTVSLDLSSIYGSSSISSGLGGMMPVSSSWAHTLIVDGDIVLHNPLFTISRTYTDRTAFTGSVTTTLDTLDIAALPGTLDTLTPDFTGHMTVNYNGVFDNFPLLSLSGSGSGSLGIGFIFNDSADTLLMTITETVLTGSGFEAALDNLDNTYGNNNGVLAAWIWAGQTVTAGAASGPPYVSTDPFTVRAVPEPASLALLGLGALGLGLMRQRKA